MKIASVNVNNTSHKTAFRQNKSIEELSGLKQVNEYLSRQETENQKAEIKNRAFRSLLCDAINVLYNSGKYQSAKALGVALRENEDSSLFSGTHSNFSDEAENDPSYCLAMGNINKHCGDIESASRFYKKALVNFPKDENSFYDRWLTYKNLYTSEVELGKNDKSAIDGLTDLDSSFLNMIYFYLNSLTKSQNGLSFESDNDIAAAYKLMNDNGYKDDGIITKYALSLTMNQKFDESDAILNERLNELQNSNLIYTKDFLNELMLLGVNTLKNPATMNTPEVQTIFYNSAQIAEATGDFQALEMANYLMAKSLFVKNDSCFENYAAQILPSVKNPRVKTALNIMVGDKLAETNPKEAFTYYDKALEIIKDQAFQIDEKSLYGLYTKIKKVAPEQARIVDYESEQLQMFDVMDVVQLADILNFSYQAKDNNKIIEITKKVLNSADSSELNKHIAQVYRSLAGIEEGEDFNFSIIKTNKHLEMLEKACETCSEKDDLKEIISDAYKSLAFSLYFSDRYTEAANAMNKADSYMVASKHDDRYAAKQKIVTTLYNYKAKMYYPAEKYALEYLNILLDKDMELTSPKIITDEVDELLVKMDDTQKRKVAAAYETLGLINLKRKDFPDAAEYFFAAVNIRERLRDKEYELANDYAGLARISMLTKLNFRKHWSKYNQLSSQEMHSKSLEILMSKYPDSDITQEEKKFHDEYYGVGFKSAFKYLPLRPSRCQEIIDKFHCYNKELNICE